MKVFRNEFTAEESANSKDTFYLNSLCPYKSRRLCGSWCALFYFSSEEKTDQVNVSAHVILGCKAGEKLLYVNEIVED